MLGKLIKHEFQSSAHSVMNIYIAAAVALAAMLLSYAVKVTWVGVIGSIALIIIGLICVVITLVAVVTNLRGGGLSQLYTAGQKQRSACL